eukprot:2885771-Ditylum_brightwellii.AAC.2
MNLIANNPKCRNRYVDILNELFNCDNICTRVEKLYIDIKHNNINTTAAIQQYEQIDKNVPEFILMAEKKCMRSKTGKDIVIPFYAHSVEKISSNLTKAHKELNKAQKNDAELHDKCLEETDQLQITHNNTNIATIIKNTTHRKELKYLFQSMRPISKGQQGSVILYIKVPAKIKRPALYNLVTQHLQMQTGWDLIDNADEVMSTLLMHNKLHLHQA